MAMQTDFLDRIKRELSISADGVRETILTIADRVNRKRQAVKLHWQASEAGRQIALQQQRLGGMIAEVLGEGETGRQMRGEAERSNLHVTLQEVSGAIKVLREE